LNLPVNTIITGQLQANFNIMLYKYTVQPRY